MFTHPTECPNVIAKARVWIAASDACYAAPTPARYAEKDSRYADYLSAYAAAESAIRQAAVSA